MSARQLLSEVDRLGVDLHADGNRLRCAGPEEVITPELLGRIKAHKTELLGLLTWDEDEAHKLIKDAWAYLCEQHQKAGKPDFDPAVIMNSPSYDRMCEACRAEDMGELRRAVEAFRVAGTEEFRDRKGGIILVAG